MFNIYSSDIHTDKQQLTSMHKDLLEMHCFKALDCWVTANSMYERDRGPFLENILY